MKCSGECLSDDIDYDYDDGNGDKEIRRMELVRRHKNMDREKKHKYTFPCIKKES